jgi:uncharacterized protein with HEPN domain
MRNDDLVRIRHMIEAAESAVEFVAGRTRSDLNTDRMLLFAVVRAIEIIGEAANKVTEETRASESAIPWRALVGMRNRLIHAYFEVNTQVLWQTVSNEIPAILPLLRGIVTR